MKDMVKSSYMLPLLALMVGLIMPTLIFAQGQAVVQGELQAAIWTSLLEDPRTANIPPADMQALVDSLAAEAQAQNITAADILQKSSLDGSSVVVPSALCTEEGIMGYLCKFNQAIGFSGGSYEVPLILLVVSGILILVVWEMMRLRKKHAVQVAASAPPWENMPR
jgi:hypothetical protein